MLMNLEIFGISKTGVWYMWLVPDCPAAWVEAGHGAVNDRAEDKVSFRNIVTTSDSPRPRGSNSPEFP